MEEKREVKPTARVVLKQHFIEVKDEADEYDDEIEVWQPIRHRTDEVSVRIFHGSKKECIEAYAGKKGKDHPGTYRAPSLSAWREEHTFKPSDEPTMVAEVKP